MTRLTLPLLACFAVACGSSSTRDDGSDAGMTFDGQTAADGATAGPDGGDPGEGGAARDAGSGPRPTSVCGNQDLEPMEQCDDGNTMSGDGCTGDCQRESFCGDGVMDVGEVCDDGNNRSGDMCRSDCGSDESCGNGIRDVAFGEACDDGNTNDMDGCSGDCFTVETCGNTMVDTGNGETCDDGNTEPFDGCGADCRTENSLVLNSLALAQPEVGCDYSGDGQPDNNLSTALSTFLPLVNEMFVEDAISGGDIIMLMSFLGLDDPANDDSLSVAWFEGGDTDDDPGNNFSGTAEFVASDAGFDEFGTPVTTFQSSIAMGQISGGPEDIDIPIAFLPLELKNGRAVGRIISDSTGVTGIEEGLLCGGISVRTFALLPNIVGALTGQDAPACDGSSDPPTFADIILGGYSLFLSPVQADVDIDGDGLESFEITDSGPSGCQPVVTACIDGDGTRYEGRDCILGAVTPSGDQAIADGVSAGLNFTAVGAVITGVETLGGSM